MKTFGSGQTNGVPLLITATDRADAQTLHTAVAGTSLVQVVEITVINGPVEIAVAVAAACAVLAVQSSLTLALQNGATVKVWDKKGTNSALVSAIVSLQEPAVGAVVGALAVDTISEATSATGVTADGVLLKDAEVYTDAIHEATGASGVTVDGVKCKDGGVTLADGGNVIVNTTTGTKIGTAVGQKLGFWNATPVVQPAAAAQAAVAAATQDTLTDSTGGTATTTLAAITAGAAYAQADLTAIKNALASLAAQNAKIKADIAAVKAFQDAARTGLVAVGIIKGAA